MAYTPIVLNFTPMKRAALIAFMVSSFAPVIAFADPGHPAAYEAYEWLHYFTSLRHVVGTLGGIALAVVVYKVVKHFAKFQKESVEH